MESWPGGPCWFAGPRWCRSSALPAGGRRTGPREGCAGSPSRTAWSKSDRLPEPLFTPATKEASGHDVNISLEEMADRVGRGLAERLKELTLSLYGFAAERALERGIVLADTKFEFGFADGELILIDEVLTPDSSRFWPAGRYAKGGPQPSFDKQYVRDWL